MVEPRNQAPGHPLPGRATTEAGTQTIGLWELARFAPLGDLTLRAQFEPDNPRDLAGNATAAFVKYLAGKVGIKAVWDLQRRLDPRNGPGLVEDLLGQPAAAIESDFRQATWLMPGPAPLFWPDEAPEGALDPEEAPGIAGTLGTGSGYEGPLRAEIFFNVEGPAFVLARYLSDGKGRFSVRVDDPRDGTPLLFLTEREALGYDALNGRLARCSYGSAEGKFGVTEQGLRLGFSSWTEDAHPAGWTLDWASVLRYTSHSPWSRPIGAGRWAVHRRSARGNPCVAILEPGASVPVREFRVYVGGRLYMSLQGIDTNPPIRDEDFRIPADFEDVPVVNDAKFLTEIVRQAFQSTVLRMAIADPELWVDHKGMNPEKWKALEKQDAALSARMRKAFGAH